VSTRIEHVARWWLKEPGNAGHRARFAAAAGRLREIEGVRGAWVGTPTTVSWDGPDQSWDVGFILRLESFDAVLTYRADPRHQEIVALGGELAQRIEVFYLDVGAAP
jgi:hypothetical protein